MSNSIAIVGIACRYPDASSPYELWENVLAGRRAFRRIPDERLRLADYWSADPSAPDRFYSRQAAVIEGFEFDRVKYKIAGSTYRTTDMTHWLALDTAARALEDAGFPDGDGLPKAATAVIVGNSLTGEFTRANLMRLRWPYIRRTLGTALKELGWDDAKLTGFLADMERRYKDPFPPVDEDTLAGGLSNTIAGRLCNQFDFNGGGFTVDGACSSSLLSVITACNGLSADQIDAAVVGGIDLSIDPFEIIGFAKTGALASGEMKVYDKHSNGFWPGEGCGMLVLLREEDARARGLRIYATIAGWGFSSDGKGGITRPEKEGHKLALRRAYELAGFDIGTVGYLEGHGTGTALGDATELRAFAEARKEADDKAPAVAISSIKGNIGHTKAAAGVAGLIKATMAVHHEVIPPATGHFDPHPDLDTSALRIPLAAETWPEGRPVRAGVSAMGFGGINAHVVLAGRAAARRTSLDESTAHLTGSRQDCELLVLDAANTVELRGQVASLAALCGRLAFAELGDLAATLATGLRGGAVRAAVVAKSPEQAEERLAALLSVLDSRASEVVNDPSGVFLSQRAGTPRIGFLFPGQGSGRGTEGALRRRFAITRDLPSPEGDAVATAVAQPRIVSSSIAGLRVLTALGIEGHVATGHSLGELTALHWAGGMDEPAVLALATERGRVMTEASDGGGAMASIAADPDRVAPLLEGSGGVVIAGYNGPGQTVISGPAEGVDRARRAAADQGLSAAPLAVSHAFHSPLVEPAAAGLGRYVAEREFRSLQGRVVSTVTGDVLPADADLRALLVRQVREPVLFSDAFGRVAAGTDLLLEVGPGQVLSGLAKSMRPDVPVVPLDSDGPSLSGLLSAVAAAYVLGTPVRHGQLFADRFTRSLPLDKKFRFFSSPCESAPEDLLPAAPADPPEDSTADSVGRDEEDGSGGSLDILRKLAAERAELPLETVRGDSHPLDELHLSSITVGQIMTQAAKQLGMVAPLVTSSFATATLADLAEALDELQSTELAGDAGSGPPAGVAPWVRSFTVELVEAPLPSQVSPSPAPAGRWTIFASPEHPLKDALAAELPAAGEGDGVALCLPSECGAEQVGLMLMAARAALTHEGLCRFVVVGDERGAAGLAKTLHLEAPAIPTTVVTLPLPVRMTAARAAELARTVAADVAATIGFSEVHHDESGARRVPVLRPLTDLASADAELPLSASDVLLVTGGGKGITAECALAIARRAGVSVALLGRSSPDDDPELAANLSRMEESGVAYRYVRADVTSEHEVRSAVEEIRGALGPVTAMLHGAGRNKPVSLADLEEDAFRQTLGPKVGGLETVLTAVGPATLKLLVTFGSIIGRAGLRGQGDYATANDWLTVATRKAAADNPGCRCLALEWSVWSGAGMGERLGVLESLTREGISPISVDDGIETLLRLLASPRTPSSLVIMGRASGLPTITLEPRELPLTRFIDQVRVYYPGVELVADAELSADSDPYLDDHLLDGDLLFPAVLGMEAMAQAAAALAGPTGTPVFENVEFLRPIVVPADGSETIRIAALSHGDRIELAIRSAVTSFQADHFRATLRYPETRPLPAPAQLAVVNGSCVPLDPAKDLYGGVFFQGKRFQRVLRYRRLASTSCVADISATSGDQWFRSYFSADLVLGDPGTRDAFMHCIQCCVPNATLLPVAVERLYPGDPADHAETVVLHAAERHRVGDTYTYDLDVCTPDGRVVERWEGLRLRAVRRTDGSGPWVPALLGSYLEREVAGLLPSSPLCAVEPDPVNGAQGVAARRRQTEAAVSRMLERPALSHRADGKPDLSSEQEGISASHGAGVTLAVVGPSRVGCDTEAVTERSAEDWRDLLGAEQFALAELVQRERGEPLSVAATRVWGTVECLRKIGRAVPGPITLGRLHDNGWVSLDSGNATAATFATRLLDQRDLTVFTILTERA